MPTLCSYIQEEDAIVDAVFCKLRSKFPIAADNWIGNTLLSSADRSELYKSYIVATATTAMEYEHSELFRAFATNEEMTHLSLDQSNLNQMITKSGQFINKFSHAGWRLGCRGNRVAYYLSVLRILKAQTENSQTSLQGLPLHLAAAVGMTSSSGVWWEPPKGNFRMGISPTLARHVTRAVREIATHLHYEEGDFFQMEKEYIVKATKLLDVACRWESPVTEAEPEYFYLTRYNLLAPALNPLMRLKFSELKLKKLCRQARPQIPEDLLPAAATYPFKDFASSSSSDSSDSENDNTEVKKQDEENTRAQSEGPDEKERKATEAKERRDRAKRAAAEEREEATRRKAAEKKRKEEDEESDRKKKREESAERAKEREKEVLRKKMRDEREAAEIRERREKAAAAAARMAREEAERRDATRQQPGSAKRWREQKEERSVYFRGSPRRARRGSGWRKSRKDDRRRSPGRNPSFPIDVSPNPACDWSFSRIRDAQKNDPGMCQYNPGECPTVSFDRDTGKYKACEKKHPWVAEAV